MPFSMSGVFNESLEGRILLSGFQRVQLLVWVFVRIILGVLLGGSVTPVPGII